MWRAESLCYLEGLMDLTLRVDLHPLCPIHDTLMKGADTAEAEATYACAEPGCNFRWEWKSGYFCADDGRVGNPGNPHQFLKPALIREHGYLYIASIDRPERQRTWRCAVKDCQNVIVDEAAPK